jgi:hypothetical protein
MSHKGKRRTWTATEKLRIVLDGGDAEAIDAASAGAF